MNQKQRAHLEKRLLRERERALRALAQFDERSKVSQQEEDGDLTTYPLHLADEGTDTMEQEKEFLLASKEGRMVYWIDDALRTLYKEPERFGRCAECDRPIAFERLDIVPWARLCVDCQRAEEQRFGEAA
ncbi:MAG TPA: TraR/DksA family transcriptional regulator [Longimicrobiales bacterium]